MNLATGIEQAGAVLRVAAPTADGVAAVVADAAGLTLHDPMLAHQAREAVALLGAGPAVDRSRLAEASRVLLDDAVRGQLGLVERIDGSPRPMISLELLRNDDIARYRAAWSLQLAGDATPTTAAIDEQALAALAGGGSREQLDVLVHGLGAGDRLGLVPTIDGIASGSAFARNDEALVGRFIDAWRTQAAHGFDDAAIDDAARTMLERHAFGAGDHSALRTLVLDLGVAERFGLPRRVGGVDAARALTTGSSDDARRVVDAWRLLAGEGVSDLTRAHATVTDVLGPAGSTLDPVAIARLRMLLVDAGVGQQLGIGRALGHEPAVILDSALAGTPGSRIVLDRAAEQWRRILATSPEELVRMDTAARAHLDAIVDGQASGDVLDAVRQQLLERGGAARMGLPESISGTSSAWQAFHDRGDAARYAAVWRELIDHPEPAQRAARLADAIRADSTSPQDMQRLRTLALDLGGSWDLGLATSFPGEDLPALLDAAVAGTADQTRLLRVLHAWNHALDVSAGAAVDTQADMLAAFAGGTIDDARAGRMMHMLLDRDELGLVTRIGKDTGEIAHLLSAAGRAGRGAEVEALRMRVNFLLDSPEAVAVQQEALDALLSGSDVSSAISRMLLADREMYQSLSPQVRMSLLAGAIPTRVSDTGPWLNDVSAALSDVPAGSLPDALLADIDTLISHNAMRLRGRTPDGAVRGYGNHPDYAELGRIGSVLGIGSRLLRAADAAATDAAAATATTPANAPAAAAAADAASAVGEALAW